jgi:hypothetical protein
VAAAAAGAAKSLSAVLACNAGAVGTALGVVTAADNSLNDFTASATADFAGAVLVTAGLSDETTAATSECVDLASV